MPRCSTGRRVTSWPPKTMRLPSSGSVLDLVATLPMTVRGQGIAWDRSDPGVIYGVVRATPEERVAGVPNKVVAFRLAP